MKRAALLLVALLGATPASAEDLTGHWELAVQVLNDVLNMPITFAVDGDKLTGDLDGQKLAGTVQGTAVTFTIAAESGHPAQTFTAALASADFMQGTVSSWYGLPQAFSWSARRSAPLPPAPRVLDFEPKEFRREFSDAFPPVLRIFPGDTVRTWTVDAGGIDSQGVRRSLGGNPQTGPFYIEGALPGDTLVVKLNRVRLNRDSAFSGRRISGSAVTPSYVEHAQYQADFDSEWLLDRVQGVARLQRPTPRLKDYTVKLRPMLGCIAVAPPRHQAFSTGYLGDYGGNLDYNQLQEGTTVYLPVFAPGALLFVGDGHAAQGDGELTGDALETSLQVEFTVDLLRHQTTGQPRAENAEYLMSLGIGNSLEDALQTATTQLARWLQRDYHLTPNETAIVVGTALQYTIAEVVDPRVHVVARIRKDALLSIPPVTPAKGR